jgi:glycosyltransferase involved in cell wall biosynthesis
MTIGIDARLWGLKHAGIGRYVLNLVVSLLQVEDNNQYVLFGPDQINYDIPSSLHHRFTLVHTDITHYSLIEQIQFPRLLNKHPVDLMHFPHFNVPLTYKKPFVVMIHDILWHQVRGGEVTTLSGWKYALKYQGYKRVVAHAVGASKHIIVPSKWVKKQLLQEFNQLNGEKVGVIYEGADHVVSNERRAMSDENKSKKHNLPNDNFFLYVGSCYPHKNVSTLIHAIKILKDQGSEQKLVIVSSRNVFVDRLEAQVRQLELENDVVFAGKLSDTDLQKLYTRAIALVHPSLSEGFGLTGLEAMKHECLVIASNKGSLPEIYGKAAVFIQDPLNPELLAFSMLEAAKPNPKWSQLKATGKARAQAFTWQKTARETVAVYNSQQ